MSHPIPGHAYGENEYPFEKGGTIPKRKSVGNDVRTGPFARAMERGAKKHVSKSKAIRRKIGVKSDNATTNMMDDHWTFIGGKKTRHLG